MDRRDFLALSSASALCLGLAGPTAAQDHPRIALIFVGASWCPVCHAAARVLAPAAERSGLEILVASQDGKPVPPWRNFVDARAHPIAAEVKALPTLLFVDLLEGRIIARLEGFGEPRQYLGNIRRTLASIVEAGHG